MPNVQVHYRIGSLETQDFVVLKDGRVHYRIGSLEK